MATQQEILNNKVIWQLGQSMIDVLSLQATVEVLAEELQTLRETLAGEAEIPAEEEVELEVPEEGEVKDA